MKVVTVVGARPQFVKAAVASRALARSGIAEALVHTGQHYDEALSGRIFAELGLPEPAVNLGIGSGGHGEQTARMLAALEPILREAAPDWVLVYGDTNSTLAAALAAAKLHLRVAHVEAGLRSFNRSMPEEINRVVTDHLAALCLAPTETAAANLAREGIAGETVRLTGDVMYDAALSFAAAAGDGEALLAAHGLERGRYVLATVHRAENTSDRARLRAIVRGLARVAETMPVLLPLHPRSRDAIAADESLAHAAAALRLVAPAGYLEMTALERGAAVVATDSGGVQKEAYFHRVPCVTLRDETEWIELVESGWNRLCPPVAPEAVAARVLEAAGTRGADVAPYGDGHAAERVVAALLEAA